MFLCQKNQPLTSQENNPRIHQITFGKCFAGRASSLQKPLYQKPPDFIINHYQVEPKELSNYWGRDDTAMNSMKFLCSTIIKKSKKYNWELYDRLEIKIDRCLKEQGLLAFIKMLKKMNHLRALIIDFVGQTYSSIAPPIKMLEPLVLCISRNLFKLKELSFRFGFKKSSSEDLKDKQIIFIANQLFKSLSLEKFTVYTGPDLSFEAFRFLSRRMTECSPKLQTLSANFENSDALIDRSLPTIINHISRSLINIQTLKLSFQNSQKFSYRGFCIFSKLLAKKLPNLHSLGIEFHGCENFDHQALNVLTYEIFTKLLKLHTLELLFPNCPRIKKEGFEALVKNMGFHQDKLKKFKLDLSWRSQRSDEEVEIIAEGITTQLATLEELTLCFNQTAISDQGLLAIENHIVEKSLNLTKLILEFNE